MATKDEPADGEPAREQDKFLPIANIARIMKEALPDNAKIAKDAKELVQQCVSDFIMLITSEASDKCQREKRKTVNSEDIMWALSSLGFEDAANVLRTYLIKIREAEEADKHARSHNAASASEARDTAHAAASAAPSAPTQHGQMPAAVPEGATPPPGYQFAYTMAAPGQAPMLVLVPSSSAGQQQPPMAVQPQDMSMRPSSRVSPHSPSMLHHDKTG